MVADRVFEHLKKFARDFDTPAGYTAPEISHGQLLMMMSPSNRHELIVRKLRLQLDPQVQRSDAGFVADSGPAVASPSTGVLRYPDLMVFLEETLDTEGEGIDPDEVLLVAEVVSPSNPENDYVGKLRDYPAMAIEHYLIVDPRDGVVIHHWRPENGTYANTNKYAFGDTLTVGAWTIDTSVFPRYGA